MSRSVLTLFFLLIATVAGLAQAPKKLPELKPDEVIARHVASIGTPEAISAAKSRVLVGQARLISRVGYIGQLEGPAQFASAGDNVLLAAIFNSNQYPYEKAAFNGKEVSIGRPNGASSELGDFLKSNKTILKEGFFGGVLSTAWPFLTKDNKLKIQSAGTTESGGRSFYKLKVIGSGMGSLGIVLFFDAESFHHVATEYTYTIPVRIPSGNNPRPEADLYGTTTTTGMANSKPTYVTLTERFSNFAKSDDLVMPLTYVIDYTFQDSNGSRSLNWEVHFREVYLNQDLGVDVFKVS